MAVTEHGTVKMYRKELREKQNGGPGPCEACKAAQARYISEYRAVNGRGQATKNVHLKARRKAIERLVVEYSERLEELVDEEMALAALL